MNLPPVVGAEAEGRPPPEVLPPDRAVNWRDWLFAIRRVARRFCSVEVDVIMTDVEDLERRKNVMTSPRMWVRKEGALLYYGEEQR